MYTSIYPEKTPELIEQLAGTPEMQRLADVGMHCGCEYAGTHLYKQARGPYSRLTHSIGVAGIVWKHTGDLKQAAAGLLHDIATPVFAHTIDFMNDDHMTQESTEDKTRAVIENSEPILSLLNKYDISAADVSDYHKYPIADNDTPMLSADRLDYTLGNAHIIYHISQSEIKRVFDDLTVEKNETGAPELCFRHHGTAKEFAEMALRNSYLYVSDVDRFSMQCLADIMREALDSGVIAPGDLYSTEGVVISKLTNSRELSGAWGEYTKIVTVAASSERLTDRYCVKVDAKRRYIDPLALVKGEVKRVSELYSGVKTQIEAFLNMDYSEWLYMPGLLR